jgi:hypothetical protein
MSRIETDEKFGSQKPMLPVEFLFARGLPSAAEPQPNVKALIFNAKTQRSREFIGNTGSVVGQNEPNGENEWRRVTMGERDPP